MEKVSLTEQLKLLDLIPECEQLCERLHNKLKFALQVVTEEELVLKAVSAVDNTLKKSSQNNFSEKPNDESFFKSSDCSKAKRKKKKRQAILKDVLVEQQRLNHMMYQLHIPSGYMQSQKYPFNATSRSVSREGSRHECECISALLCSPSGEYKIKKIHPSTRSKNFASNCLSTQSVFSSSVSSSNNAGEHSVSMLDNEEIPFKIPVYFNKKYPKKAGRHSINVNDQDFECQSELETQRDLLQAHFLLNNISLSNHCIPKADFVQSRFHNMNGSGSSLPRPNPLLISNHDICTNDLVRLKILGSTCFHSADSMNLEQAHQHQVELYSAICAHLNWIQELRHEMMAYKFGK